MFEITLRNLSSLQSHLASQSATLGTSSSAIGHHFTGNEFPQDIVQDLRLANDKYRVDVVGTREPADTLPTLQYGTSMDPELDEAEAATANNQPPAGNISELSPSIVLYLACLDFDRISTPLESPPFDLSSTTRSALTSNSPPRNGESSGHRGARIQDGSSEGSVKLFVGLKALDAVPAHRQDAQTIATTRQNDHSAFHAGEGGKPDWIWSHWDTFEFHREQPFWREST